jgi:hypothetical protein
LQFRDPARDLAAAQDFHRRPAIRAGDDQLRRGTISARVHLTPQVLAFLLVEEDHKVADQFKGSANLNPRIPVYSDGKTICAVSEIAGAEPI